MNDTDILALRASPLPVYTTCQRCGEPKRADVLTLCHGCAESVWQSIAQDCGTPCAWCSPLCGWMHKPHPAPPMQVCADCGERWRSGSGGASKKGHVCEVSE